MGGFLAAILKTTKQWTPGWRRTLLNYISIQHCLQQAFSTGFLMRCKWILLLFSPIYILLFYFYFYSSFFYIWLISLVNTT